MRSTSTAAARSHFDAAALDQALLPQRRAAAEVASERARVAAHLAAETLLRSSRLDDTPETFAARTRQADRLAAYRRAGTFPANVVSTERTPVFVDPDGVRCAVGHLMDIDGHGHLTSRIAQRHLTARVDEFDDDLADEAARWAAANGMTVQDLAAIQPGYGPGMGFRPATEVGAWEVILPTLLTFAIVHSFAHIFALARTFENAWQATRVCATHMTMLAFPVLAVISLASNVPRRDDLGMLPEAAGLVAAFQLAAAWDARQASANRSVDGARRPWVRAAGLAAAFAPGAALVFVTGAGNAAFGAGALVVALLVVVGVAVAACWIPALAGLQPLIAPTRSSWRALHINMAAALFTLAVTAQMLAIIISNAANQVLF